MEKVRLEDVVKKTITGEWGTEIKNDINDIYVIRTADFNNDGTINYENILKRNIKKDKINEKKLEIGDIIVEKSGGTDKNPVGRVVFFNKKDYLCLANNFTQVIRIKENINSKYIFYNLLYLYKKGNTLKMFNKTTGIQNLQMKQFLIQKINLVSLNEQNKIVNILDKVQEIIDLRKRQIEKLDELIKAQFVEMFESRKYPTKRIDEVATLKSGTTFSKEYELENGELLYCKISDMNLQGNEKYMRSSKTYVSKKVGLKSSIPANSVIFPKRGGAIGTNKKRILLNDTCVDLNTMGVTPMEDINIQYLYYYFINIDLATLCDGSAVPQLNNKNIGPLEIAVPPIELQNKFEELVKQIDKQKFMIEKSLKETEDLQESLMNKYFN